MDNANGNGKKNLNYAVWLLARRRYHTAELQQKIMLKKNATLEETEGIIHKLEEYKYINDQEYLSLFIRDQLQRKPQGIRLIKQRLLQKGIPAEQIEAAIAQYHNPAIELEQAQKALQQKIKTLHTATAKAGHSATPQQQKAKLYRFLAGRGFSPQTILKLLS